MYVKYNAVLRGQNGGDNMWTRNDPDVPPAPHRTPSAEFKDLWREFVRLCKQNMYPTTLHAINSAVIKLGKLMKVKKVYRGLSDKTLPQQMLKKDRHDVRGGVEVRCCAAICISKALI